MDAYRARAMQRFVRQYPERTQSHDVGSLLADRMLLDDKEPRSRMCQPNHALIWRATEQSTPGL